jgi:hypothetical protein
MDSTMTRTTTGRRIRTPLLVIAAAIVVGVAATPASAGSQKIGSEEFGLTFKQLVRKAEAVEDHIAGCMQDAGFDYVANDFDSIRRAMNADKTAPGLSEGEFRREFGFGISTQFDKPIVQLGLGEENADIRAGLAVPDQAAFDRTLLGEHTDAVFANALESEDFSRTGGCTRRAVEREFTKKEISAAYINPGDQRIDEDQRVKAAYQRYARCLRNASAAFEYRTPDEVEEDLLTRFEAIVGSDDPEGLDEVRAADLAELQDFERNVAQASFRCEERFVEPVREKVEKEIYGRLPS